jgi:hypothetical protein
MIQPEKIAELLKLPVEDRREVVRLLEESLTEESGCQPSRAAGWLLNMAGRYSGGPGNSASRADEILRSEIGQRKRN